MGCWGPRGQLVPEWRCEGHMGAPAGQLRSARAWAAWQPSEPYTIGLEEEVMLLDPEDWSLAQRSDDVLPQLPPRLAAHVSAETHQGAIELSTDAHVTVGEAVAQLRELRAWLAEELAGQGPAVAAAGTQPFAPWSGTRGSPPRPHQGILRPQADPAPRGPTFP